MANSSGRGDAGTIVWAVAAVLVVAVFVVWLSMTAQPSVAPTTAEPDSTEAAPAAVTAADFEPNVDSYRGREVILQDVPVVEQMGSSIVWVELPSGSPFLIKVSDEVAANGLPTPQSRVNVIGTVREKSAAVLQNWQDAGVLQSAGQRTQAEFGSSYIEATAIRPAG